jgi:hypothetical protein
MVRRLVQYKEVGRIVQHSSHRHIVSRKLKRACQRPQSTQTVLREILLQLLNHGEVGIQHIERLLREVPHGEIRAEPNVAGIRR